MQNWCIQRNSTPSIHCVNREAAQCKLQRTPSPSQHLLRSTTLCLRLRRLARQSATHHQQPSSKFEHSMHKMKKKKKSEEEEASHEKNWLFVQSARFFNFLGKSNLKFIPTSPKSCTSPRGGARETKKQKTKLKKQTCMHSCTCEWETLAAVYVCSAAKLYHQM